jgi:hypothetical protein
LARLSCECSSRSILNALLLFEAVSGGSMYREGTALNVHDFSR